MQLEALLEASTEIRRQSKALTKFAHIGALCESIRFVSDLTGEKRFK